MKQHYILLSLILSLFIISACDDDNKSDSAYELTNKIDINDDGITDFQIKDGYIASDDIPSSHQVHSKEFIALNNNMIPSVSTDKMSLPYGKDEVIDSNTNWTQNPISLASKTTINGVSDKFFKGEWVETDIYKNFYMPIKFIKNGKSYYGWVNMSIEKESGKTRIYETYLNSKADIPCTIK